MDMLKYIIEQRLKRIVPHIVMGDEDSMDLTQRQLGEKEALEWVLASIADQEKK